MQTHTHTHTNFSFYSLVSHAVSLCVLFRSVDILELSEQKDLLKFHYHTLRLYSAICALGNNRVAHALCSHVDESQLLLAIENKYMPGNTYIVWSRGQAKVITCVLKGYGWNYFLIFLVLTSQSVNFFFWNVLFHTFSQTVDHCVFNKHYSNRGYGCHSFWRFCG